MRTFVSKWAGMRNPLTPRLPTASNGNPRDGFSRLPIFGTWAVRAVRLALMRHARKGSIRKVGRGLYNRPRQWARLGRTLPPLSENVVQAMQARDHSRVLPSGAHAANLLGLSTQVPVRAVYLTDGRARKVALGQQQIVFKHAATRQMATAGRISGTVIQALRWLGRDQVDSATICTLRRRLSDRDKKQLFQDLRYAPAWIAAIMQQVAGRSET